jgi:hypothetical protein
MRSNISDTKGTSLCHGRWCAEKHCLNAFFAIIMFAVLAVAVHAQSWTNRYDGIAHGMDYMTGIAVDKSGNVFVAGSSAGADSFAPDFVLIKYSDSGTPLWVNRYTKYNKQIHGGKIAVDTEGNLLVVGSSGSDVLPSGHMMVMKVSASGASLWTNTIPGDLSFSGYAHMTLGPNGELAVITQTNLVIYTTTGIPLSTNAYDYAGTINDQTMLPAMKFDQNGNLLLSVYDDVGWTTVKYLNNGERSWTRKFASATEYALPSAIAADRDGNVIITGGITADPFSPSGEAVTVKYSPDGMPLWTNRNRLPGGGVAADTDGNIFVGGMAGLAKYSPSGVLLWKIEQPDLSPPYVYPQEIKIDGGQNPIVSAVKVGTGTAESVILKYSKSGSLLWTNRHTLAGGPFSSEGRVSLDIDGNGNIFLGVTSEPGDNGTDLLTIRFVPPSLLDITPLANAVVLNWINPALALQSSANLSGTFTNIPGATSPHTNFFSGSQQYFRLGQ